MSDGQRWHLEPAFSGKLGVKPGHRVHLVNPPTGFSEELAAVSPHIILEPGLDQGHLDVILAWPAGDLSTMFQRLLPSLRPDGAIWVVIPKKASKTAGPSFQSALQAALPLGLVDNKTLSFSPTEYGIRFVIRRGLRKAAPQTQLL